MLRGAEAAAFVSIVGALAIVWRWVRRMRAKARDAFARSIGAEVGRAIEPVVKQWDRKLEAIDSKLNAHISLTARRRTEDDARWAKTEKLYAALHEHMRREDEREDP